MKIVFDGKPATLTRMPMTSTSREARESKADEEDSHAELGTLNAGRILAFDSFDQNLSTLQQSYSSLKLLFATQGKCEGRDAERTSGIAPNKRAEARDEECEARCETAAAE